jgi:hypothetical protein
MAGTGESAIGVELSELRGGERTTERSFSREQAAR